MWLITLLLIVVHILLVFFYYYTGIKPLKYWKQRGVPTLKVRPYFGSIWLAKLKRRAMVQVVNDHYEAFSDRRYFGFYNMNTPQLMIRDPNLIKTITLEDFEVFPEHRRVVPDGVDSLWDRNLFAMKGGKDWKNMRGTLTPAFTATKLKMMFSLMKECSEKVSNHFLRQGGMVTVEFKDVFTRFANDVIGATTFGISCDSLENKDNKFYLMGKTVSNTTGWRNRILSLYNLFPKMSKIVKFPFFPKAASKFFNDLVKETIRFREETGIIRPDIIHFLQEARKGKRLNIVDEDITAQCLIFFFGGFDTLSNMICFTFYELALNCHIQEKLFEEVLEHCSYSITYDVLNRMIYLNMIIEESLRKWPPFAYLDRRSTSPYTIQPETPLEEPVHLDIGTVCVIPVFSIHRNSEYHSDPETFDPERFNEINRKNIKPFTYLPFGKGPRNCIGERFAMLVGKLITVEIIKKFEIVRVEKTQVPLVLSKGRNNAVPEKGFWLGLKPRK